MTRKILTVRNLQEFRPALYFAIRAGRPLHDGNQSPETVSSESSISAVKLESTFP